MRLPKTLDYQVPFTSSQTALNVILRAELPDRKGKRKLKPDAVPTIFDHRPRKKPRLSTEQRLLEKSEKRGKNKTFHYIQPGAFKQGMKTHATAAH